MLNKFTTDRSSKQPASERLSDCVDPSTASMSLTQERPSPLRRRLPRLQRFRPPETSQLPTEATLCSNNSRVSMVGATVKTWDANSRHKTISYRPNEQPCYGGSCCPAESYDTGGEARENQEVEFAESISLYFVRHRQSGGGGFKICETYQEARQNTPKQRCSVDRRHKVECQAL